MAKRKKREWVLMSENMDGVEDCIKKGHSVKVSYYGPREKPVEINIDCEDCFNVLASWEADNG